MTDSTFDVAAKLEAYRGELRRWCQQQNSVGTVSFQEAVSMLPALLLVGLRRRCEL